MRNSIDTPNVAHCCTMGASTLIHAFFEVTVPSVTKLMIENLFKKWMWQKNKL